MNRWLAALVIVLLLGGSWLASHWMEKPSGSPLQDLPPTVSAPPGELSLVADFQDVDQQGVALYIVNRTAKPVVVEAQDGDAYIKLEAKVGDTWQRAQRHAYSWCGNSYFDTAKLAPGRFLKRRGYVPAKGQPAAVRYKIYSSLGLVSNEGQGVVDPMDIEAAAVDEMAIRFGDIDVVKRVLFDEPRKKDDFAQHQRIMSAVQRLRLLPAEESLPVLRKVATDPESSDEMFQSALSIWYEVDRQACETYVLGTIHDPQSKQHLRMLRRGLSATEFYQDPGHRKELIRMVRDRDTVALGTLIGLLGNVAEAGGRREVEQLLLDVIADDRYPFDVRERARFTHHLHFGSQPLEATLRTAQEVDAQSRSATLHVTLSSKTRQDLAYTSPTEIVHLFLEQPGADGMNHFVHPREGVVFHQPVESPRHRLQIQPGEGLDLQLNLDDYFDLRSLPAAGESRYLLVWISLKLPGSQNAQLINAGKGFDLSVWSR